MLIIDAESALSRDREGQPVLVGGRCGACGKRMFPRSPVCPGCQSVDIASENMPRRGRLYSFTTVHVGPIEWQKPIFLGYVDLPNDVRVFTHLRSTAGELAIDQEMQLDIAQIGTGTDGKPIETFVFRPGGGRP